jgi:hypothetical protein
MQSIAAINQKRIAAEQSQALSEAAKHLVDTLLGSLQDHVTRPHRLAQKRTGNIFHLTLQKRSNGIVPSSQSTAIVRLKQSLPTFRWSSVIDGDKVRFFVNNSDSSNSLPD